VQNIRDISIVKIGIVLIIVVGLITGVGGIVTSDERPPIGQAPPITENTTTEGEMVSQSQSLSESLQTYAVTATSADAINPEQLAEYGEIGTQADARIEVTMAPSDVTNVENISWVTDVRPVVRPEPAQTDTDIPGSSDGVGEDDSLGVQQAHENGITGEDVEVGIIDAGFDPNNQAIASNVVDTGSFRSSGGDPAHGTSVAEIVTRTAPDSQLYLVSTSTGTDTEAAINYLRRQDVDIIVHSAGFPAFEDDGDHILTDNINAATESGTLFVNSAGNEAQTHWEGEFRDTDRDDFHEWTRNGDELNCLPNCDTEYSGPITVYIRWTDQGQESHYRPSIFNTVTDEFIATDTDRVFTTPSGTKYTILSVADIRSQPVDLVIDHVSGPADDEIEVIIFEGPRKMEQNIPVSSISAPADVPAAMTVAAYQVGPRRLAPYSSRGPTDDGRTGIDVTGYTNIGVENGLYGSERFVFTGTSAAAPYAGGVAALVEEDQAGDQSPTELTNTLRSSSDDILDPGVDTASGSGVVNAADAVDVGDTPETPEPTDTPEPIDTPETPGDSTSIDITRTVSANEVVPSEQTTITTTIRDVSGSVSTSSSYDPQLVSAVIQSVTVNNQPADPIIEEATVNGSTVTLGDVGTDATVTITETLTVGSETNVTHSITGDVTSGETTTAFDPVTVTVTVTETEPDSVVDEYDANNDGEISIIELGQAGQAFASGELTITELGEVGAAFAS